MLIRPEGLSYYTDFKLSQPMLRVAFQHLWLFIHSSLAAFYCHMLDTQVFLKKSDFSVWMVVKNTLEGDFPPDTQQNQNNANMQTYLLAI